METRNSKYMDRRILLGALFIFFGGLFLLEDTGWLGFSLHNIIFSWQMLLIFIGILNVSHKRNSSFGAILIAVGTIFLIPEIFNISYNTDKLFLPIILVTIGVVILFHKRRGRHDWDSCKGWKDKDYWRNKDNWRNSNTDNQKPNDSGDNYGGWNKTKDSTSDYLDEVNVFGGSERKIYSKSFRGGKVTSIFGGSTYDLLNCELGDGKNMIDVVNIFGGSKLIIPANWKVHVEVVSIFGGFVDKRRGPAISFDENSKELYITGVAIFGGGEINSI